MFAFAMESELKANLLKCASSFARARKLTISTVGRLAAGDWQFFQRLQNDKASFTARKYDEVIGWFDQNWPDGAKWPGGIARPSNRESAA